MQRLVLCSVLGVEGCDVGLVAGRRSLTVSGFPPLLPPADDPPDVAVFKERLRVLTVGGMRNKNLGVSPWSAVS